MLLDPADIFDVALDSDGVTVSLPPIEAGDRGELLFVVAWAQRRESTWLAVDKAPSEILSQAGCGDAPGE